MLKFDNDGLNGLINDRQIEIINSGRETLEREWCWNDAAMPYNCLYFIPRGESGWLRTAEDGVIHMKPGYLYLVPKNLNFAYGTDGEFEQIFFHFHCNIKKESAFDALEGLGKIAYTYMPTESLEMAEIFDIRDISSALTAKSIIYRAVASIAKKYDYYLSRQGEYSDITAAAIGYIMRNLSARLDAREVTEAVHVSRSTLSKHFSAELGRSVKRYIMSLVIDEAKMRLRGGGESVCAIASDLGFSDQFVFSRSFKAHTGASPTAFRRSEDRIG